MKVDSLVWLDGEVAGVARLRMGVPSQRWMLWMDEAPKRLNRTELSVS